MTITAEAVKQLRERTGAGMMECKKALVEVGGDLDAAAELMRKQGLAKADKKAARLAAEGTIVTARSADGLTNAIIFCNRKREVAALHRSLVRHGFSAIALHGDMDQSARTAALDQFRKNEVTLLVASDVAARGLDIPAVSHIFNFDVPYHPDDYVHRIGRTGRAGRSGTAVSIVAPADHKNIAAIERPLVRSSSNSQRARRSSWPGR